MRNGKITVSGVIFYALSFFLLVSIPVTVILIQTQQTKVSKASSNINFPGPPSIRLTASTTTVKLTEPVSVSAEASNMNWYGVYFSQQDPASNPDTILNILQSKQLASSISVEEGASVSDFSFRPSGSGYIFAVAYQLQNYLGDFSSADVACMWDDVLYIYERDKGSLIDELFSNALLGASKGVKKKGEWRKFTTCENSGVIRITLSQ